MDLGLTNLTEHCIDARPVKQPPRRVPLAYANEEKKLVDHILQQGIIQSMGISTGFGCEEAWEAETMLRFSQAQQAK
ncbi:Hypothetical predicted protein [Mytilus galloprovincialis]|uniref:Uncharacterized protein n=1 Tax=Mytilus galloprovincialis TaxID=29158 RepID=A0A8B6G6Z5_MYTGA|nr:Hypothetical predicted protein [Mytilus galloprovincialis]